MLRVVVVLLGVRRHFFGAMRHIRSYSTYTPGSRKRQERRLMIMYSIELHHIQL